MPDVRYVCLSDLHLGAANSLLTSLRPGSSEVDPLGASPSLLALVGCLRQLVESNENQRAILVLNGDALDLALSQVNVAAMGFERFAHELLGHHDRLFESTVHYLPGNHDHHIWELARESRYEQYLESLPPGQPLTPPHHATPAFLTQHDAVKAELLTTLLHRRERLRHLHIQVSYPNLALEWDEPGRCVVFHHGHFVESTYLLMSRVKDVLFPRRPSSDDVWDWEADNFAWIDFFWSTLGRSGQAGADVGVAYDMLHALGATSWLAHNVARALSARAPRWVRRPAAAVAARTLARLVERRGPLERGHAASVLSEDAQRGLDTYLRLPLARQLTAERPGLLGRSEVTFVFGHTHKPFSAFRSIPGHANTVRLYNTGGWVVDHLTPEPLQGGGVVLVDEHGEAVSLRMYDQGEASTRVRLEQALPPGAPPGPFFRRLRALIHPDQDPWASFSTTVAAEVRERRTVLGRIIETAMAES